MNYKEFLDALERIREEGKFSVWRQVAGTPEYERPEEYVRGSLGDEHRERAYCYLLNTHFGCDLKTEAEKLVDATVESAEAGKISASAAGRSADAADGSSEDSKRAADAAVRSAKAAETANRRAWLSWGPAALAVILSFAAFYRGCVDTRRNNRSDNVPTEMTEAVETQQQGTD
jgi:hypothetical protein